MRTYGWIPDLPDYRDISYKMPFAGKIDSSSDLGFGFSPVENQGTLGSCTGQGFAAILEYLDRIGDGIHTDVSRLFIYYNERKLIGTTQEDSGARIRDGIKALVNWGACDESIWRHDRNRFMEEPPPEAYKDGEKRRIKEYRRVSDDLKCIKYALTNRQPVIFGFSVYTSFESLRTTETGVVEMPWKFDSVIGGHCVVFCGHDDKTQMLKFRNSYGTKWGDKGYGYMPYEYVEAGLCADFWVVTQ